MESQAAYNPLEPRMQAIEVGQSILGDRVKKLESQHDQHDHALFGFFDERGQWNDGVVQHVADIRNFSGLAVALLAKAVPAVWAAVAAMILYLVRAACKDWIWPHLPIHG